MFVIISKILSAHIYSILLDEVIDLSNTSRSQHILVLRYIDSRNVHEQFIKFIDIRSEMSTNSYPEDGLDDKKINKEEQVKVTWEKLGKLLLTLLKNQT